jgi:hypothetical protein
MQPFSLVEACKCGSEQPCNHLPTWLQFDGWQAIMMCASASQLSWQQTL